MPFYQWLLYLFLGAAAFGGGGAVLHNMPPPAAPDTKPQKLLSDVPPAQPPGEASQPDNRDNAPARLAGVLPPTFDVVRIEPGGDGVIAGRAEPGWTVVIGSDETEIARAVADENGEWAVVLERPLAPGEYALGLRSMAPTYMRGLVSEQKVAISVAGAKQPDETIVALSQPGQATRLMTPKRAETAAAAPVASPQTRTRKFTPPPDTATQPAATTPATPDSRAEPMVPQSQPEQVISFGAVDYELDDKGEGRLFLSGQAEAGTRVTLYLDNDLVGKAVAGADGTWAFESLRTLRPQKRHMMRADAVQPDGQIASRAEVPFEPPLPEPPAATERMAGDRKGAGQPETSAVATGGRETASVTTPPSGQAPPAPSREPSPSVGQAPEVASQQAAPVAETAQKSREKLRQIRSIVVRSGDTLWHIAERRYGNGARYTAIYRDNRRQIRNPHLIFPGQEFRLPAR